MKVYQSAVPVMLAAIAAIYLGYKGVEPLAGIASVAIFISVLIFWFAIYRARSKAAGDDSVYSLNAPPHAAKQVT